MIEVSGLSDDITFVVYDDVIRNVDEPGLAKWANQTNTAAITMWTRVRIVGCHVAQLSWPNGPVTCAYLGQW
jgi:hypothetical protein